MTGENITEITIIGAGMAGLACGRRLARAGLAPVVLDKGRGIGGRIATRRAALADGAASFDHGAQYVTAQSAGFAALLHDLGGAVSRWDDGTGKPHLVGVPGMSSLPRAMAAGIDVRSGVEVTALHRTAAGWDIVAGPQRLATRRLVMAVPAPQAAQLLGPGHEFAALLGGVAMAPCLTLMAAFAADAPRPFLTRASDSHPLAWIAQDSSKTGRNRALTTWVAQAGADWSMAHLEKEPAAIAAMMLPLLAEVIGAAPESACHAAAHRWRYAHVTMPIGQAFMGSDDRRLYLGGDWCPGAGVEAAWRSGDAIADDILAAG